MAGAAPPPQQVVVQTQPQGNGLGVAGFVLSLLGLFTCGITSLLGTFPVPGGIQDFEYFPSAGS